MEKREFYAERQTGHIDTHNQNTTQQVATKVQTGHLGAQRTKPLLREGRQEKIHKGGVIHTGLFG